MKAVEFKQQTVVIGENQDEYENIPAHVSREGVVTTCFELNEDEIDEINKTGKVYIKVLTFGKPLQPIEGCLLNPF